MVDHNAVLTPKAAEKIYSTQIHKLKSSDKFKLTEGTNEHIHPYIRMVLK